MSPDALDACAACTLDRAGVIQDVNEAWLERVEQPRGAVVGRALLELVTPDSRRALEGALRRIADGQTVRGLDLEIVRGGDHPVAALFAAAPRQDGSSWVFLEYGDRGRTLELYRRLLEAAPESLAIVGEDGTMEYVNLKTEELFGYRRDELVGQPVELLVPERLRVGHVGHRERFGSTARAMGAGIELVGRRKDGSEVPVEVSLSPVVTAAGRVVQAAIRDISARRRLEAETALAHEQLRNAVESIEDAFAVIDPTGTLVLHNSAYRSLFHAHRGALVGARATELLELWDETEAPTSEPAPGLPDGARDALREGRRYRVVTRRTHDGGLVATISDRTEDAERSEELRQASAAKSEFLASMSHELRTPLNAVLGFAQLLQRDRKTPLTDRQRGMVDHVVRGGEHLLRLIDDVLDLARIEAGRVSFSPERIDVAPVVEEVCATLAPIAARSKVAIEIRLEPDVGAVRADRTRFAQILMNFGSNAIKYGRPGGRAVFVATRGTGRVRLTVEDDGTGIAEDKQDKLFQPFQRAGQETGPIEGTGIGLAITKRLAELMDGTVGFRSQAALGSAFWVELPEWKDEAMPAARPAEFPAGHDLLEGPGVRMVVVYIEDNPSNVAFMAALLADFDRVQLKTAPTGELGVELVLATRPDLVIADINLPGMSGFEVLARLRELPETKDIPVIALSAAAMERDAARAKSAGFYRYLTKPARVDELLEVLNDLLGAKA